MRTRNTFSGFILVGLFWTGLQAAAQVATASATPTPTPIIFNAPNAIHSMDGSDTIYSSIQISGTTISNLSKQTVPGAIPLPTGAAIYPGFIDSHSHAISVSLAQSLDPAGKPYWISLANVNVMLQKPCSPAQPGSTSCFTPVKTQGTVNSLLGGPGKANSAGWVLGWNYEPSRLACKVNGVLTYGFLCPNFENQNKQTAVSQLNKLQPTVPLLVTSESGHIVYVNQAALDALNICNVSQSNKLDTATCYTPVVNPTQETALALTGQLDEDLAIYAISYVEGVLAASYGGTSKDKKKKQLEFYSQQILNSLSLYSQLGYTTVQEGAASEQLIEIYLATAASTPLPATMAFLEYDGTTAANFQSSVSDATNMQKAIQSGGYDMFIAGMKAFADGSNQGYTGEMDPSSVTYTNLNQPFTEGSIFSQPYDGLADYDTSALNTAISAAHAAKFPLWVHTNGNQAQTNVLTALAGNAAPPLRDVVVHFTMPTQTQVNTVPQSAGVTFLSNDFYYYYQPLCEQVLGTTATANLYPALWAQQAKLHYSLHSDAGVTPPSPLFEVWVASTRNYQHGNWLPKMSAACLAAVKTSQKISKLQAMRAYANEAAWLYNRDTTNGSQPGIGSLQTGYAGDLVVLSADPLAPQADLSTIYVLYTVHNGKVVYPTTGTSKGPVTNPSIWPK